MYTNQLQGTVRIKIRNAYADDELLIILRKSKIELQYHRFDTSDEFAWNVLEKKVGSLPVVDDGPETLAQYMFIDDTFGIDYSAFQSILAIHKQYESRLRDRLI